MEINRSKKKRSHRYYINEPRSRKERKLVNIKSVLVWWCLYVLSNTYETFEAQFIKKLNNAEAELKKSVTYTKNACTLVRSHHPTSLHPTTHQNFEFE